MKPIIGISMGDPAGCGPEISVKALHDKSMYQRCRPLIVGDARMLEDSIRILEGCGYLQPGEMKVNQISAVSEAQFTYGTVDVYHLDLIDMDQFEYGKLSAMCGDAAFKCVVKVIELAMDGKVDATVTNALNKIYKQKGK